MQAADHCSAASARIGLIVGVVPTLSTLPAGRTATGVLDEDVAVSSPSHARPSSRTRLPAGPPRRRADLRGDDRRLAGGADRDAALRRGRDAGPLRRPGHHHVRLQRLRRAPVELPGAAPAVPDGRPAAQDRRLRPHHLEQQRLRPRRCTSPRGALHVCYCHSPFRYAWHEQAVALPRCRPAAPRAQAADAPSPLVRPPRRGGVDQYIANGRHHARPDPPLLGPGGADRLSARRRRALLDRRA